VVIGCVLNQRMLPLLLSSFLNLGVEISSLDGIFRGRYTRLGVSKNPALKTGYPSLT